MAKKRLEEIRKIRLEKVDKLRKMGIDPYPSEVPGKPISIKKARVQKEGIVEVVGRIWGWRGHGDIIFADLKDESGQIQLWFQKSNIGSRTKELKLYDIGDFLYAKGKLTKTKAGELTVDVTDFTLLTKSIRPIPSTWHGLKNSEERYRKRYLDMLLNPEVKERLDTRSEVIKNMRKYLDDNGYVGVETPTLQPLYGGGFARPFVTHHNALDTDLYLLISDEMYLKRLIVGGYEKVYEITKVFRNEGVDHDHNPEFTNFEAMIAYKDYKYGMEVLEKLVEYTAMKVNGTTKSEYRGHKIDFKLPWQRLTMVEAVKKYAGVNVMKWESLKEAKGVVSKLDIPSENLKDLKRMKSIGEVIAFVFEELVEEKLVDPTIIYDFPIEVSPLAKKCDDPRFTQRFEMFAAGMEFGNNYTELNDPVDLKQRFIEEKNKEEAGFEEAHQTDYDYLTAIEHGFPPTCGINIGVDRLVLLLTGAKSIREIIAFPTLKPLTRKVVQKKIEVSSTTG